MATTRKKPAKPGDNDGGVRVERASDRPKRAPSISGETTWINPREPLPDSVTKKLLGADPAKPKPGLAELALRNMGLDPDAMPDEVRNDPAINQVVAAIIIAQALDRLGEKIITAAAVSHGISRGT